MASALASLLPHALTPQDWAQAANTKANTQATQAGIPLTQAQTQGVQASTQATQLQNQATQRQVASQQALQQYLMSQSGQAPQSGLPSAPGQQPNAQNTAPPNAPPPPPGGYPRTPEGMIDRTGAAPTPQAATQGQTLPPQTPGLPPRAMPQQPPAVMPGGMASSVGGYPAGIFNSGELARRGVLPKDIFDLQNQYVGAATKYQELSDKQRADYDKRAQDASQLLVGIQGADPATQDAQWPAYVAAVQKADSSHPEFAVGAAPPQSLPADSQQRDQLIRAQLGAHNVLGQVLANAKTTAETTGAQTKSALEAAQTPGERAKSHIEQTKDDLQSQAVAEFRRNPTGAGNVIDAVLPANLDPTANASYKQAVGIAMKYGGPDAAQKVIEEATAHAAQIGMQTSPTVIAGKAQTAGQEEKARAPYQQGIETNVAAFRNRLEQGNTARAAQATSLATLNEARGANQQFQNLLKLGQSGNAAAQDEIKASLPSLIARVQGIKSAAAARGDATLGDVADKAIAGLSGNLSDSIQKGLPALFDTLESAATNTHNLGVRGNNAVYGPSAGVTFKEEPAPQPRTAQPTGQYKAGDTRVVGGHTYKRDDKGVWHPQ